MLRRDRGPAGKVTRGQAEERHDHAAGDMGRMVWTTQSERVSVPAMTLMRKKMCAQRWGEISRSCGCSHGPWRRLYWNANGTNGVELDLELVAHGLGCGGGDPSIAKRVAEDDPG